DRRLRLRHRTEATVPAGVPPAPPGDSTVEAEGLPLVPEGEGRDEDASWAAARGEDSRVSPDRLARDRSRAAGWIVCAWRAGCSGRDRSRSLMARIATVLRRATTRPPRSACSRPRSPGGCGVD